MSESPAQFRSFREVHRYFNKLSHNADSRGAHNIDRKQYDGVLRLLDETRERMLEWLTNNFSDRSLSPKKNDSILDEIKMMINTWSGMLIKANAKTNTPIPEVFSCENIDQDEFVEFQKWIIFQAIRFSRVFQRQAKSGNHTPLLLTGSVCALRASSVEQWKLFFNNSEGDLAPWMIKHAVIGYPTDPMEYLRKVLKEISVISSDPEFKAVDPGVIKHAVVRYPHDPKAFLRKFMKDVFDITREMEFKNMNPGLVKRAAVHNPGNPRMFLRQSLKK